MDLNRARRRSALAAVLALAASPNGFTVTGFAEQVRVMTGQSIAGYSARHASYDLTQDPREAPGVDKPGRTRRYQVPPGCRPDHHRPADPPRSCHHAQQLDNVGEHTVQQIADLLSGHRSTVYRHLDKTTIGRRPRPDAPPAATP